MDKLQRLHQKNLSVEEYWQKMMLYIIRAGINEDNHSTISRFLSGLKLEIRNKVELLPYKDLNDLIQLSIKVEKQSLRKQSSQKQSSNYVSYDKEEVQRGEEHIKETSLEPSQNLPKYAHISRTQTREIPCFKCFGNDHLASQCSNERSIILRDKDNNSSQDKETSESEENMKVENNQQVKVELSLGTYKDKVLCDAVPKETCHVLLRRALQNIKNFMLHGLINETTFTHKKEIFHEGELLASIWS